ALRTQRLAHHQLVGAVEAVAAHRVAVRAALRASTVAGLQVLALGDARVHGPEARGGEGHEETRVLADGVRDSLAAEQPGERDVAGIALVGRGARGADRRPTVAAGDQQRLVRLVGGAVDG